MFAQKSFRCPRRSVPIYFFALLFLSPVTFAADLQSITVGGPTPGHSLFFQVGADAKAYYWYNMEDNNDTDEQCDAIDYKVQGPKTITMSAKFGFGGWPLVGGKIERPFKNTPEQHTLLEQSQADSSLKENAIFLDLLSLGNRVENPFLRFFSRVRVDYKKRIFIGKGTAVNTAEYAPFDGAVTSLPIGEEFRFRADFKETNISWALLHDPRSQGALRFGVYKSTTKKPHETTYSYTPGGALIADTTITGKGAFLQVDSPAFSSTLKMGKVAFEASDSAKTAVGADPYGGANGGFDFLFNLYLSPRINLIGAPDKEGSNLVLAPSAGVEFRFQSLNVPSDTHYTDELSNDVFLDYGAMLVYIWR